MTVKKGLGFTPQFKTVDTTAGNGRDSILPPKRSEVDFKADKEIKKRNSGGEDGLVNKSFSLEKNNVEKLRDYSFKNRISASAIVNELISNYLKDKKIEA